MLDRRIKHSASLRLAVGGLHHVWRLSGHLPAAITLLRPLGSLLSAQVGGPSATGRVVGFTLACSGPTARCDVCGRGKGPLRGLQGPLDRRGVGQVLVLLSVILMFDLGSHVPFLLIQAISRRPTRAPSASSTSQPIECHCPYRFLSHSLVDAFCLAPCPNIRNVSMLQTFTALLLKYTRLHLPLTAPSSTSSQ